MTYQVIKSIEFCYGHRLQNYSGPCRNVHGHNARAEIIITSNTLDDQGMACDFRTIKEKVKKWINENIDHRMILQKHDPLISVLQDLGEPVYVIDNPPTAENIARLICEKSRELELAVNEVRLWESNSSCAVYSYADV